MHHAAPAGYGHAIARRVACVSNKIVTRTSIESPAWTLGVCSPSPSGTSSNKKHTTLFKHFLVNAVQNLSVKDDKNLAHHYIVLRRDTPCQCAIESLSLLPIAGLSLLVKCLYSNTVRNAKARENRCMQSSKGHKPRVHRTKKRHQAPQEGSREMDNDMMPLHCEEPEIKRDNNSSAGTT